MQHFPVEIRRPRDVVANGRGRVEGDGRRVGHLFGRRLRVLPVHRTQAGRGGGDRRVRRVGRVSRRRIAVFVAADQDDRPDGRLFGLGDAFGRRLFAHGELLGDANGPVEGGLAVGRFRMPLGQRVLRLNSPRAPCRIGNERPQGKLF